MLLTIIQWVSVSWLTLSHFCESQARAMEGSVSGAAVPRSLFKWPTLGQLWWDTWDAVGCCDANLGVGTPPIEPYRGPCNLLQSPFHRLICWDAQSVCMFVWKSGTTWTCCSSDNHSGWTVSLQTPTSYLPLLTLSFTYSRRRPIAPSPLSWSLICLW